MPLRICCCCLRPWCRVAFSFCPCCCAYLPLTVGRNHVLELLIVPVRRKGNCFCTFGVVGRLPSYGHLFIQSSAVVCIVPKWSWMCCWRFCRFRECFGLLLRRIWCVGDCRCGMFRCALMFVWSDICIFFELFRAHHSAAQFSVYDGLNFGIGYCSSHCSCTVMSYSCFDVIGSHCWFVLLVSCLATQLMWVCGRLVLCPYFIHWWFRPCSADICAVDVLLCKNFGWCRDRFRRSLAVFFILHTGLFCYSLFYPFRWRFAAFDDSICSVKDWPCSFNLYISASWAFVLLQTFALYIFSYYFVWVVSTVWYCVKFMVCFDGWDEVLHCVLV